jgi:long-chain acyl-CoA synthetase
LTGDIAEYNPVLKEIKLIDRKKGIIKMSQGEFISVNQIEDAIVKAPCVENCYLSANRYYPYAIAVVCPNKAYLKSKGINCDDVE